MRKIGLLVLVLARAVWGWAEAGQDLEARIDKVFAPWNRTDSPGCAVGIGHEGRMAFSKGYGMAHLEHGVPITPGSAFYAGSVSKQFTAAAVALLVEAGTLSLDHDIRSYFPEMPSYQSPIRVRHMIHHTSGLRDYLGLMSLAGRDNADSVEVEEVMDLLARQKALNFTPGDEYLYSNSGYFLLAQLVERASGKPISEFARENMFEPLGLEDTRFHDDRTRLIPNRAEGYLQREGRWAPNRSRFDLVGSGGIFTTVEDLLRWAGNYDDNRLGKGDDGFVRTMHTRGRLNSGEELEYAFGLRFSTYRGLETVGHAGALGGYRANLMRIPGQHLSIAILCNLDRINPGQLAQRVADVYLGGQFPEPPPDRQAGPASAAAEPERQESADAGAGDFAGTYFSEELQIAYRLVPAGGRLFFRVGYREAQRLDPQGEDQFSRGRSLRFKFRRDDSGAVTGFRLDAGRVRNLLFVKPPDD